MQSGNWKGNFMSDDNNTMLEAKKAVEALNAGFEAFKAANDENLKARDVVLEKKMAKINADLDAAQKVADDAVLAVKRASRIVSDGSGGEVDLDAKALKWAKRNARAQGTNIQEYGADDLKAYKSAFDAYLRKDDRVLDAVQTKALSVGSDPDGGYVVHPDMSGRIVTKEFETSVIRAFANIQNISTDALEGIFDLDESAAVWVGETAARAETNTPQLGAWRIPVHEIAANPAATQKLLDDAEINMETWLANKVGEAMGRAENTASVTGDGVGKWRGFLTYANGTTLPGTIEQSATGVSGGFAASGAGVDIFYTVVGKTKARYRANASWAMNRTTVAAVRKLKDSDGAYIWQPSAQAGIPDRLAGYPIAPFEDMPDIAADSLSIAFADFREAYQIVDRSGIRVLRDPYTNKPYVHFYTVKRSGGDVVNFEAIKLIKFGS